MRPCDPLYIKRGLSLTNKWSNDRCHYRTTNGARNSTWLFMLLICFFLIDKCNRITMLTIHLPVGLLYFSVFMLWQIDTVVWVMGSQEYHPACKNFCCKNLQCAWQVFLCRLWLSMWWLYKIVGTAKSVINSLVTPLCIKMQLIV